MGASILPNEILHDIFRRLSGHGVVQCRAVCTRWRDAVDSLSNAHWEQICNHDWLWDEYTIAHKKYGLPWRDVYKSLNSWAHISSAEMTKLLLCDNVKYFKVLPNGIVACLQDTNHSMLDTINPEFCDTIVYYNVETLQECGREVYDFVFYVISYDENKYLKVFQLHDDRLCIVIKENKNKFFFELLPFKNYPEFTLINEEVYYRNSDRMIYIAKLKRENGIAFIEPGPFDENENEDFDADHIIAFSIENGDLKILCEERRRGYIYTLHNGLIQWPPLQIDYLEPLIFTELREHGFDWRSRPIQDVIFSKTYIETVFYSHGTVMLSRKYDGKMKAITIHYVPFFVGGGLDNLKKILKDNLRRTISLRDILPDHILSDVDVDQLDIIENKKSHKILTLLGSKLFVLDLQLGPAKNVQKPLHRLLRKMCNW